MVWSLKKIDALPDQQLVMWEGLLERRTGIQFAQPQHSMLQSQIAVRMRELGIHDYLQYFDFVNDDVNGVAEWQILVDRLVVKETSFFRHRPSVELVNYLLEKKLSPQKTAEEKKECCENDSFEIWSVGCSTGEEPYTLAAIAHDFFELAGISPYFGVTAVDVSLPALSIAKRGIYNKRSLNLLDDDELKRYFVKRDEGQYEVIDAIRKRVCFSQLNILHLRHKPLQLMDIIFCQNVLIYFRRWRRRDILKELVKHLKPGGILVIGLGEITEWHNEDIERLDMKDVHAYVKREKR